MRAKEVAPAPKLGADRIGIKCVRVDRGDLAMHARKVRKILDEGGLENTFIFASGNLDEYRLHALLASGAPIDGFGMGAALDVSSDCAFAGLCLQAAGISRQGPRKRSEGKATWPGKKQVYRRYDSTDVMGDVLTLEEDNSMTGRSYHPRYAGWRAY